MKNAFHTLSLNEGLKAQISNLELCTHQYEFNFVSELYYVQLYKAKFLKTHQKNLIICATLWLIQAEVMCCNFRSMAKVAIMQ